jgi:hypothetical protein
MTRTIAGIESMYVQARSTKVAKGAALKRSSMRALHPSVKVSK